MIADRHHHQDEYGEVEPVVREAMLFPQELNKVHFDVWLLCDVALIDRLDEPSAHREIVDEDDNCTVAFKVTKSRLTARDDSHQNDKTAYSKLCGLLWEYQREGVAEWKGCCKQSQGDGKILGEACQRSNETEIDAKKGQGQSYDDRNLDKRRCEEVRGSNNSRSALSPKHSTKFAKRYDPCEPAVKSDHQGRHEVQLKESVDGEVLEEGSKDCSGGGCGEDVGHKGFELATLQHRAKQSFSLLQAACKLSFFFFFWKSLGGALFQASK